MKCTAGAWRVSLEFNEVTTSPPGILEGSKAICNFNNPLLPPEEVAANGRLLAAAPDLLAALKEIVAQSESYCHSTGHKEPGAAMFGACDAICHCIPAARSAIAQAEGRHEMSASAA